jgi:hypothetical protein
MLSFRPALLLAGCLCSCAPALAADLQEVTVERVEDRYRLRSETLFDASAASLYVVLTDYDQFEKISSVFTVSRSIGPDELGRPQFYNAMEGCVLFFCVSFERYGHLELDPETRIRAIVDPDRSDFKYSVESWQLLEADGRTRLIYEFEMEPAFWVPPVIGPFYIRRALRAGAVRAVDRIEAMALGKEPEVPVDD